MENSTETLTKENVLEQLKKVLLDLKKTQYLENEILSFIDAKKHLDISKSILLSMINKKEIPFYITNEKGIYFRKSELDYWIFSGKISVTDGFDMELEKYLNEINPF